MPRDDRFDDEDDLDDAPPVAPVRERARSAVKGPAIGLVLTGLMMIGLGGGVAVFMPQFIGLLKNFQKQVDADPNAKPEDKQKVAEAVEKLEEASKEPPISLVMTAALGALTTLAGVKLYGLSWRGFGIAAAVLNLLPVTGCCCVGLPVGVWTLVVLFNSEVRAGFAAEAARRRGAGPETPDDFG